MLHVAELYNRHHRIFRLVSGTAIPPYQPNAASRKEQPFRRLKGFPILHPRSCVKGMVNATVTIAGTVSGGGSMTRPLHSQRGSAMIFVTIVGLVITAAFTLFMTSTVMTEQRAVEAA